MIITTSIKLIKFDQPSFKAFLYLETFLIKSIEDKVVEAEIIEKQKNICRYVDMYMPYKLK